MQEAPPAIIMYHLNMSLSHLREEVSSISNQNKVLQNEVNKRDFQIEELQNEVGGLKAKILENDNMILHRNTEEVKRLNQEIKQIETAKEFEENRLKTLVKTYEAKVDQLTKDNFMSNEKLLWVLKSIADTRCRWAHANADLSPECCATIFILISFFNRLAWFAISQP